jgi:ribonuclease HII
MTGRSVAEIRVALARADGEDLHALLERYADDPRAGVSSACAAASSRLMRTQAEDTRLESLYTLEAALLRDGYTIIAGIDEVGRGALAGPLTAAAVVLPQLPRIRGLDDSKKLSPARREQLSAEIHAIAISVSIVHIPPAEIDAVGIGGAVKRAMAGALGQLPTEPDHVLVDGLPVGLTANLPQSRLPKESAIVKGDGSVAAIAAASVVAKVARDALMRNLAPEYPDYEFERNKGYGSPEHLAAIAQCGLTPAHRRSFAPCGGTVPLF